MKDRQFVTTVLVRDGEATPLRRVPFDERTFDELALQDLLFAHPALIPAGDIEPLFAGLRPLARELPVGGGFLDLIFMNGEGYLTLVETKLWRNPEARRTVVAQIIDYASHLSTWTYDELRQAVLACRNNAAWSSSDDPLVDLASDGSVLAFSLTRRYHVARLTPADSHGARSCSSGVPARRITPDAMPPVRPRAAFFQSSLADALGRAIVPGTGTQTARRPEPQHRPGGRRTLDSGCAPRSAGNRPSLPAPACSAPRTTSNSCRVPWRGPQALTAVASWPVELERQGVVVADAWLAHQLSRLQGLERIQAEDSAAVDAQVCGGHPSCFLQSVVTAGGRRPAAEFSSRATSAATSGRRGEFVANHEQGRFESPQLTVRD